MTNSSITLKEIALALSAIAAVSFLAGVDSAMMKADQAVRDKAYCGTPLHNETYCNGKE